MKGLNTMNDSMAQVYRNNSKDVNATVVRHAASTSETPSKVTPSSTGDSCTTKEHVGSATKLTWKAIGEAPPISKLSGDASVECTPEATPASRKSAQKKVKKRQSQPELDDEGNADSGAKQKVKRRRTRGTEFPEGATISGLQGKKTSDFQVRTSSVHFADIGGCKGVLQEVERMLLHLRHPEIFTWLGVKPPQGFLLHGPPGCGKTLLAHAIAGELQLPFIKLAATEVVSGVSGESESALRDLFSLAVSHAPCILFVDEIDAICQKREMARRDMERRIVMQLLTCMDELSSSEAGSRVLVIGATSSPDSLDPALRRPGRFDREIGLGIPDQPARESILRVLVRGLRLEPEFSFYSVSRQTPGFVGADLVDLVREASLCAVNRALLNLDEAKRSQSGSSPSDSKDQDDSVTAADTQGTSSVTGEFSRLNEEIWADVFIATNDFMEALKLVQPTAKREGFATIPDVTWEDVGALEDVREELSLAILAPVRYPEEFSQLGLTTPPGILLAGPPGCGKTLLAKAIANESGINFISVKGPELLNMYVGESERAVRQVFQRARNSSPCVIFFDELDALCPRRSEVSENSVTSRVVNQLLAEMDGVVARKQVFIMGATNRPDIIDPAVLRPGRLDKVLFVGLPNAKDRAAILHAITKFRSKPKLSQDVDILALASDQHTVGYTGADLSALVREAAIISLKERMKLHDLQTSGYKQEVGSDQKSSLTDVCEVEMKHFLIALAKLKPSVSQKDQNFYHKMADRFGT